MSKAVKSIASFALPIVGGIVGGPAGAAVGGAIGGAVTGGGLKGAALGGLTSFAGGAGGSILGSTGGFAGGTLVGTASGSSAGGLLGNASKLLQVANLGASIYGGITESRAAEKAAKQQSNAARNAINQQTQLLKPYIDSGNQTIGGLTQLVNDPTAQRDFIQSNPFYQSLAEDAKDKLFANAAARGKVGSGGTAEALQNSLLLLGNDLLQQDIGNKQALANNGQTAATNLGNSTSNLLTQQGNAQAAGTIGSSNAITGAINNGLAGATELYKIGQGVDL